jgi:hypothetical protein
MTNRKRSALKRYVEALTKKKKKKKKQSLWTKILNISV